MKRYKCLIVDDERLAQELLESYVKKIPYLELVGCCSTAMEAMQFIAQNDIQILFLDIQMPDLTGIEFLRALKQRPATIFTTAYSEYAIEGYELSVVDYLLKPIEFDRFFQAVNKAVNSFGEAKEIFATPITEEKGKEDYFFVKADNKIVRLEFKDILFVEALQKYIQIYTVDQKIVTLLSLSKIELTLPIQRFIRIHRSFIINIEKVESIEGNMVKMGGHSIPVSKGQRELFMERVREKGLF
ncbi:MAG: two-component system LytT family response regulator [Saprospiraceae bacterium]|jgi:two-component system LytT family response regulator